MCLFALSIRNIAAARQPSKLLDIVTRLFVCSLRLRKIRFGTRHLRFSLPDAPLSVESCLLGSYARLLELLLQHCYLFLRTRNTRVSPLRRGPRLLLSRSRLLFVKHSDYVTGLHSVAFT